MRIQTNYFARYEPMHASRGSIIDDLFKGLLFIMIMCTWTVQAQVTAFKVDTAGNTLLKLNFDAGFSLRGSLGTGTAPDSGAGTRLMWFPAKGAFRAGTVVGSKWDYMSTGNYSVGLGYSTLASNTCAVALGCNTTASSAYSTAMGLSTIASGSYSTAIGISSTASGEYSTVIGSFSTSSGWYSTAMGHSAIASGNVSTAMGDGTTASGQSSIATGYNTTSSGDYSSAMGFYTQAQSYGSTAVGRYNVGGGNATSWVATDPLFEIGNSLSGSSRSNAFTVLKNGNVGIGTISPGSQLHVLGGTITLSGAETVVKQFYFKDETSGENWALSHRPHSENNAFMLSFYNGTSWSNRVVVLPSGNVGIGTITPGYTLEVNGTAAKTGGGSWTSSSDIRLKDVDGEYTRGLADITRLRSIRFHYKPDNPRKLPSDRQQIGFIAQEVREMFPECVTEGNDGYLDFNMHAINVALVNAVKELKTQLDAERSKTAALEERITSLSARLSAIETALAVKNVPGNSTQAMIESR